MSRKKFVAGNWKMYKTPSEAAALTEELKQAIDSDSNAKVDVVVCPTYTALDRVNQALQGSGIHMGAQDLHWEDQGAFTGKISHDMLKDVGVAYVIIGHSEQRSYFHETDETVNKKTTKALSTGLLPIICVGETLEERESGKLKDVVRAQVTGAFTGVALADAAHCVIAYEPVWAIGTGKTASPEQAQEMHAFIRDLVKEIYGVGVSDPMRILYGGSVKPDNAAELFSQPDIDGGLIGGASLKAADFAAIVKAGV
ncbi:MAG: triose-phosphate isomerase [Leptospirales bacterium]|jgi:triosephosphate isomerase